MNGAILGLERHRVGKVLDVKTEDEEEREATAVIQVTVLQAQQVVHDHLQNHRARHDENVSNRTELKKLENQFDQRVAAIL